MTIGYVRACRLSPSVEDQAARLFEAGADKVYLDDGTTDTMTEIFAFAHHGDTILTDSLSALASNRETVYNLIARSNAAGIPIRTLKENLDTSGIYADALFVFLTAIRRLERGSLPVRGEQPEPEYLPDYFPDTEPDIAPDWIPELDDIILPEYAPESNIMPNWIPEYIPAANPGSYRPDNITPDWIPEITPVIARSSIITPDITPDWLPEAVPILIRPCVIKPDITPDWIPETILIPSYPVQYETDILATPDWIPDINPVITQSIPVQSGLFPDWIPDAIQHNNPDRVPKPDRTPAWLPEFTPETNQAAPVIPIWQDWIAIAFALPADAVGRLPDDAILHLNARPTDNTGNEIIFVRLRPDGDKALPSDNPTDEDTAQLDTNLTGRSAAERMIIRQIREQRRIMSLQHIVIAVVIVFLILLGILAIALPKLNSSIPAGTVAYPWLLEVIDQVWLYSR